MSVSARFVPLSLCFPAWCSQRSNLNPRKYRSFKIYQDTTMADDGSSSPAPKPSAARNWLKRDRSPSPSEYEHDLHSSPSKKMKLDKANENTSFDCDSEQKPEQKPEQSQSSPESPKSSKSPPKSSPRSSSSSPKSSRSTIEQHIPGVNDIMTGGIGTSPSADVESHSLPASIDNSEYDATVGPFAINEAVKTMPFKILSQQGMVELDLFEYDLPAVLDDNVKITMLGLKRAIDEAHGLMDTNVGTEEWDEILLGTMLKRLGRFADEDERDVQYVEDLVPVVIEDRDEEYWGLLKSQGRVWEELGLEANA